MSENTPEWDDEEEALALLVEEPPDNLDEAPGRKPNGSVQ